MNLLARQGRTLMTAATAAAVVAAGGMGAGCGKKLGREAVPETHNTISFAYDTLSVIDDTIFIEMVRVEGGAFTMGCTSEQGDDCLDNEKPAHSVTLSSYYIGKYEVTQGLWKAVMGNDNNPSYGRGHGDSMPVESVSWDTIVNVFIPKLNKLTGKTYRLPTEAEWEYAARGGNKSGGYKYSGSNNIEDVARFTSYTTIGEILPHKVGAKSPNELGIYDMSGNVDEWVSDWYGPYSSTAQTNPKGPDRGANHVKRGGGWRFEARNCRVSFRGINLPAKYQYIVDVGFRLASTSP